MRRKDEILRGWEGQYNCPTFIKNDPVQFPRKYINEPMDCEISAILTALISFGNRKQIIKKAQWLDDAFNGEPYNWILYARYKNCIQDNDESFYRTITNRQMREWCDFLKDIVLVYGTIEYLLRICRTYGAYKGCTYLDILKRWFGFRDNSAAKRLAMFMRWMVRDDGIVDIGIWKTIDKNDLVIPLDTHVHRIAIELGITKRKTTDIKTAQEITDYFRRIFPGDPARGDFALFGYGVNNKK